MFIGLQAMFFFLTVLYVVLFCFIHIGLASLLIFKGFKIMSKFTSIAFINLYQTCLVFLTVPLHAFIVMCNVKKQ